MKAGLFKYIIVPILCVTSFSAYYYLNTLPPQAQAAKTTTVLIKDLNDNSNRLIQIKDTSQQKNQKPEADEAGMLPDVEFLKFVIKKGREGIPVLRFRNFLKFI
ncbi:MAG: hypothetical protein GY810_07930 [Aureispira sp.]|nr:hypothetical protein [Aureispira sp.]